MADPTARDEGLGNLEAFLSLLETTRGALGEIEASLDSRAVGLADEALRLAARTDALSRTLSSVQDSLTAGQLETAADLAALGQAAAATVDARLGAVRGGLEVAHGDLQAGVASAREQLEAGSAEIGATLTECTEAALGLEAQVQELGAGAEEIGLTSEVEIATATATLEQAASQAHAILDAVSTFFAEGLAQYARTAFDSLVAHLETEVEPTLTGLFEDLGRSLLALFERLDVVTETTGEDLIDTGTEALTETARFLAGVLDAKQREGSRTESEIASFLSENEQARAAIEKGGDTVSALGPLAPVLAAAREVAVQVQEMMNILNPFD